MRYSRSLTRRTDRRTSGGLAALTLSSSTPSFSSAGPLSRGPSHAPPSTSLLTPFSPTSHTGIDGEPLSVSSLAAVSRTSEPVAVVRARCEAPSGLPATALSPSSSPCEDDSSSSMGAASPPQSSSVSPSEAVPTFLSGSLGGPPRRSQWLYTAGQGSTSAAAALSASSPARFSEGSSSHHESKGGTKGTSTTVSLCLDGGATIVHLSAPASHDEDDNDDDDNDDDEGKSNLDESQRSLDGSPSFSRPTFRRSPGSLVSSSSATTTAASSLPIGSTSLPVRVPHPPSVPRPSMSASFPGLRPLHPRLPQAPLSHGARHNSRARRALAFPLHDSPSHLTSVHHPYSHHELGYVSGDHVEEEESGREPGGEISGLDNEQAQGNAACSDSSSHERRSANGIASGSDDHDNDDVDADADADDDDDDDEFLRGVIEDMRMRRYVGVGEGDEGGQWQDGGSDGLEERLGLGLGEEHAWNTEEPGRNGHGAHLDEGNVELSSPVRRREGTQPVLVPWRTPAEEAAFIEGGLYTDDTDDERGSRGEEGVRGGGGGGGGGGDMSGLGQEGRSGHVGAQGSSHSSWHTSLRVQARTSDGALAVSARSGRRGRGPPPPPPPSSWPSHHRHHDHQSQGGGSEDLLRPTGSGATAAAAAAFTSSLTTSSLPYVASPPTTVAAAAYVRRYHPRRRRFPMAYPGGTRAVDYDGFGRGDDSGIAGSSGLVSMPLTPLTQLSSRPSPFPLSVGPLSFGRSLPLAPLSGPYLEYEREALSSSRADEREGDVEHGDGPTGEARPEASSSFLFDNNTVGSSSESSPADEPLTSMAHALPEQALVPLVGSPGHVVSSSSSSSSGSCVSSTTTTRAHGPHALALTTATNPSATTPTAATTTTTTTADDGFVVPLDGSEVFLYQDAQLAGLLQDGLLAVPPPPSSQSSHQSRGRRRRGHRHRSRPVQRRGHALHQLLGVYHDGDDDDVDDEGGAEVGEGEVEGGEYNDEGGREEALQGEQHRSERWNPSFYGEEDVEGDYDYDDEYEDDEDEGDVDDDDDDDDDEYGYGGSSEEGSELDNDDDDDDDDEEREGEEPLGEADHDFDDDEFDEGEDGIGYGSYVARGGRGRRYHLAHDDEQGHTDGHYLRDSLNAGHDENLGDGADDYAGNNDESLERGRLRGYDSEPEWLREVVDESGLPRARRRAEGRRTREGEGEGAEGGGDNEADERLTPFSRDNGGDNNYEEEADGGGREGTDYGGALYADTADVANAVAVSARVSVTLASLLSGEVEPVPLLPQRRHRGRGGRRRRAEGRDVTLYNLCVWYREAVYRTLLHHGATYLHMTGSRTIQGTVTDGSNNEWTFVLQTSEFPPHIEFEDDRVYMYMGLPPLDFVSVMALEYGLLDDLGGGGEGSRHPGSLLDGMSYEALLALDDSIERKGVTPSRLEKMPVTLIEEDTNGGEGSGGGPSCTICLDGLVSGQVARRLPCSHVFHDECILNWFSTETSCPNCRHNCAATPVPTLPSSVETE